jgi:hypothetical protein
MVDKILAFVPNVLTAVLILVAAYFVGRVLAGLVTSVLAAVGVDRLAERAGVVRATESAEGALGAKLPRVVPSRIAGTVVLVVTVLFAAMEAFNVIHFEQLSSMVNEILGLVARIVLAVIIFGVGVALANLAARAIGSTTTKNAQVLSIAARVSILVLAGAMALRQLGLANEIINLAFGLLLGGIAAAVAIAFGVGGRQVAGRELERWVDRAHANAETSMEQGAAAAAAH